MEAYRIDRFGSVDGIVLRSSEDPRPGPKEVLMALVQISRQERTLPSAPRGLHASSTAFQTAGAVRP